MLKVTHFNIMRLNLPTSAKETQKDRFRFFVLLAIVTLTKIPSMALFPLTGDEAYHWEWSRRLAPAYYDHPGAIAWAVALSTRLTGIHSEWSIRLPALVALIIVSLLMWRLTRRVALDAGLGSAHAFRAGEWAGLMVAAAPVFAVLSMYCSTDPPLLLFWMMALDFGYRAFRGNRVFDWLGLGCSLGLALNSKFLAFLLVAAVGVTLLLTPEGRRCLKTVGPWLGMAAAVLFMMPVLIWNLQNDWATFRFNFMIRQAETLKRFSLQHAGEYVGGQLIVLLPVAALLGISALGRISRRLFSRRANVGIVFLWVSALIPLGIFFLVSWKRRVGIHWPAAGWLSALILAAVEWVPRSRSDSHTPAIRFWVRLAARGSFAFLLIGSGMAWFLYAAGPLQSPAWVATFWNQVYGWREAGRQITALQQRLSSKTEKGTVLFCQSYAMAAQVAFYTPGHPTVLLWAPPAVHGQEYRRWDRFEAYRGSNVLLVGRQEVTKVLPMLRRHCRSIGSPQPLVVSHRGSILRKGEWVHGEGFDGRSPDWSGGPDFPEQSLQFSGHRALEEVAAFVAIGPRPAGSEGMGRAAAHVAGRLRELGLAVKTDIFEDGTPYGRKWFQNVEARLPGNAKGCVLFVSHMDTKVGISEDFVGANDSGSSTGFLIELARALSEGQWSGPDLYFLFVDGEECLVEYGPSDGLHGSRHAAARWKTSSLASQVRAVIVVDMIGDRDLTVTIPRNGNAALIQSVFRAAEKEGFRSYFRLHRQTILDDHVPFLEAGFPAILLIDFEYGSRLGRNDYWHTPEDTFDKLSAESLEIVGRVVIRLLHMLAEDPNPSPHSPLFSPAAAVGEGG